MTLMKLGIQSLQFMSGSVRPIADLLDDAIEVLREADRLGFDWVSASQHWVSAPTIWPQPLPVLARLAPEVPHMRLMTQMLVLPLHNPIDVAEQVSTLDHISRGRVTLGCAVGYRELELEAAGFKRADRVGRLEESLELMKRLWAGEEVWHRGRWWTLSGGQVGFRPYQEPHPPVVLAAQSPGAVRRAARLGDGVFFGPQMGFADIATLAELYRREADRIGHSVGMIGAGRSVMLGTSRGKAAQAAYDYAEKTMSMYSGWDMQERGMVDLHLDQRDLGSWALIGSSADIVEQIAHAADGGLDHITLTAYNLPRDRSARLEYVQRLGEEVVAPVKRMLGDGLATEKTDRTQPMPPTGGG